jgi:Undecaprenyl-phosphate glucose phosphotransferase
MYQESEPSAGMTFAIPAHDVAHDWNPGRSMRASATAFLARCVLIEFLAVLDGAYLSGRIYSQTVWPPVAADATYVISAILLAVGILITSLCCRHFDSFQIQPRHRVLWNGATAVTITFTFLLSGLFLLKIGSEYSRATFILQIAVIGGLVLAVRTYAHAELRSLILRERVSARRAVVVGEIDEDAELRLTEAGVKIVRLLKFPTRVPDTPDRFDRDGLRNIAEACRAVRPDDIIILTELANLTTSSRLAHLLSELPVSLHVVPTEIRQLLRSARLGELGALVTFELFRAPLSVVDRALKRTFDVLISCVGLVFLTPILLAIAATVKLDSPGPVLFRQIRHGYNNEAIRVFKFRTMTSAESGCAFTQAQKNDRRVTRVGRILRRTNIDELPQLLNVLAGDMSIVGPRPHPVAMNEYFRKQIAPFSRRHNVKPGITGWAQVNGHRGETDTLEKMQRRIECDLYYIDNWSFFFDIKIILLTLFSKSAYVNAF